MKLREENASDFTVEQVFNAHCERSVREKACAESGALSWDVTITLDGGGARIQVDRVMPPAVPDFIKKFLGETISIRQVEQWKAPDASGTRTADVKLTIQGQPASMIGEATLAPDGTGSTEVVEGEVKVAVPFIGRKIEPEIVKVIVAALKIEQETRVAWLKEQLA